MGTRPGMPLEQVLIADSTYNSTKLKARSIRAHMLELQCAICGLPPEWHGRPLVLRLDHVNGEHSDNRLENLRLVCPNCDSQLPTFAGRNKRSARHATRRAQPPLAPH